jgi:hypothetical protein
MMVKEYLGRCSCGFVEICLRSRLAPNEFQPRSDAPTCNFCREHDGVWVSDPDGMLALPPDSLTLVRRFASEEVRFHSCPKCESLVYALFEDEAAGRAVAVVRVALMELIRTAARPTLVTNFEGEGLVQARRRRLEKWTPVVSTQRRNVGPSTK